MRVVLLLLFAVFISSCSSNKEKDEESKVAKLVKFDKTVKMKRLWSAGTGSGKGRKYLRLVPSIDKGVIYTSDPKGQVFAFDVETGKRQWKSKTKYKVSGAIGAGFNRVFFGTIDGRVVTLDAANGEKLWEAKTSSEILAPPATNGSIVVAQTIDARVFAFDAKTGEQVWSYDHLAPVLSLRGTSSPVITATQVICAFDNGQIVSFSAVDGSRTWEARVSQPKGKTDLERIVDVDGTPKESSGIIFAGSYQGNLIALTRAQGKPIWRKALSTYQNLSVANGKVFVSTDRSRVIAFNSANGDVLWQNEQLLNRQINAPAAVGDYVVVVDEEDYLHVLSQDDGSFAYRFKPKGDGFHSPMLSYKDKLYLLSDDGKLSSYEIAPL
ncbi:outer membrane protein assembly factor BamB [Agarilytica rhodophyticola]|uniref:outer membrane protein assembly factor BamB n=1 Tax=Agarilytica rhodophyticola TaxID=1737490 RepID=UPI001FE803EF|nr:outer membrane protein assembly factor BamB [Agarilytica rhodophyticola]